MKELLYLKTFEYFKYDPQENSQENSQ